MFEYFQLIVFHLVERIAIVRKSSTEVLRKCNCMLGFSYNTLPTRHEIPRKPYLQEENNIPGQTHKTIKHCGYGGLKRYS